MQIVTQNHWGKVATYADCISGTLLLLIIINAIVACGGTAAGNAATIECSGCDAGSTCISTLPVLSISNVTQPLAPPARAARARAQMETRSVMA